MSDFASAHYISGQWARLSKIAISCWEYGWLFRFVSYGSPGAKWRGVDRSSRFCAITLGGSIGAGTTARCGRFCWFALVHCVRCGGAHARRTVATKSSPTARHWTTPAIAPAAIPPIPQNRSPAASGSIRRSAGSIRQPDPGPRYRDRRLERRGFLSRAALWRRPRRLALLPGVPLSQFHQTDPRRHSGDPRLSRDANAGPQHGAAAGAALAAELPGR